MMNRMILVSATAMLLLAACSENKGAPTETEVAADAVARGSNAAADADDDTLEPAAPKVEEGEEHDESKPHDH